MQTYKEILVSDVISQYMNCVPDWKKEIIQLLSEALSKKTISELKALIQ